MLKVQREKHIARQVFDFGFSFASSFTLDEVPLRKFTGVVDIHDEILPEFQQRIMKKVKEAMPWSSVRQILFSKH